MTTIYDYALSQFPGAIVLFLFDIYRRYRVAALVIALVLAILGVISTRAVVSIGALLIEQEVSDDEGGATAEAALFHFFVVGVVGIIWWASGHKHVTFSPGTGSLVASIALITFVLLIHLRDPKCLIRPLSANSKKQERKQLLPPAKLSEYDTQFLSDAGVTRKLEEREEEVYVAK